MSVEISRVRRSIVAMVLAGMVIGLTGCSTSATDQTNAVRVLDEKSAYTGAELDTPYARPATEFIDTAGKPYALSRDATSPVTLVFFGYTNCDDVCGTVLADVSTALRRADASVRDSTRMVFVTTDPARDTPAAIRQYLDRFDPSFIGLTADLPRIEQAAAALGIALTGVTRLANGGYDVGHSSQLIGFGPDGLGHVVWTPATLSVPGLRADLTTLLASTPGEQR